MLYVILIWEENKVEQIKADQPIEITESVKKVIALFESEVQAKQYISNHGYGDMASIHELHYDFTPSGKSKYSKYVILTWEYGEVVTEVIGMFHTEIQAKAHAAHQGWKTATVHVVNFNFMPRATLN